MFIIQTYLDKMYSRKCPQENYVDQVKELKASIFELKKQFWTLYTDTEVLWRLPASLAYFDTKFVWWHVSNMMSSYPFYCLPWITLLKNWWQWSHFCANIFVFDGILIWCKARYLAVWWHKAMSTNSPLEVMPSGFSNK